VAPEIFAANKEGHTYTNAVDVYSFGVILSEIFTRREPYKDETFDEAKVLAGHRPKLEKSLFENQDCLELYELICACWNGAPEQRPPFAEISAKLQTLINDEQQRQQMKLMKRGSSLDVENLSSDDTGHSSSGKEELVTRMPRRSMYEGGDLSEYGNDMISASSILREVPMVLKVCI